MKKTTLLACFLLMMAVTVFSQDKKRKPSMYNKQKEKKEDVKFLEKQWWLGFKAGANTSKVNVTNRYSVISPSNYELTTISKKYDNFGLIGSQATLEVSFYFKGFLLSFQPTYQHTRFSYTTDYEWTSSSNENDRVQLSYYQEQKIDYAILPLIVKYDIYGNKLRPYVQAGIYSALRLNATKALSTSGVDYAAGGKNEFKTETIDVGVDDLFAKYHWGLLGGVGLNYNFKNHVRLNFDVMYKLGMSNITSTQNRYGSDRLSGVGDAMDDMKLDNLSISLGCLFPLRFLQSSLQTLDR
ncbi:outer membrane beta-barrel protein [Chryseolinea sp. T2]|uniref:outer membrane beta-barrel protein n=1 Tax=Chryseolinea sp. T2 TaxID=3129255 RepID=UPI00307794D5